MDRIARVGSTFVATGMATRGCVTRGAAWTSTDGIHWQLHAPGAWTKAGVADLVLAGLRLIAVGQSGCPACGARAWTSIDRRPRRPTLRRHLPPTSALITKIMAAGVLNLGYAVALPRLYLDPNSNQYVGANAAVANAIAQRLGVKVVAVPTAFAALVAGIQTGKIDLGGGTPRPQGCSSISAAMPPR